MMRKVLTGRKSKINNNQQCKTRPISICEWLFRILANNFEGWKRRHFYCKSRAAWRHTPQMLSQPTRRETRRSPRATVERHLRSESFRSRGFPKIIKVTNSSGKLSCVAFGEIRVAAWNFSGSGLAANTLLGL